MRKPKQLELTLEPPEFMPPDGYDFEKDMEEYNAKIAPCFDSELNAYSNSGNVSRHALGKPRFSIGGF